MAKGRKKPLHGAKKYNLLALPCSVKDCDEEFFVCRPDGKRFCEKHTFMTLEGDEEPKVKENSAATKRTLALLGF